jgi:hypothetical protein
VLTLYIAFGFTFVLFTENPTAQFLGAINIAIGVAFLWLAIPIQVLHFQAKRKVDKRSGTP